MTFAATLQNSVLKLGDQGPKVTALQLALKSLKYPLSGTGYFGGATDTAVEDFQRSQGLRIDGVVGPDTAKHIDAMVAALGASTEVPKPLRPETTRPLWLTEAISRIGTLEAAGSKDNPTIVEWAQELGGDIAANYKHDSIPWCALFIDSCLHRVGQKSTGTLWALDYRDYGVKLSGPAVGAIAPMVRGGGGHVIFIVGRDRNGNYVGVGGNQSDAVNIRSFPRERLKDFRWPSGPTLPLTGWDNLPIISATGKVSLKEV